MTGFFAAIDTHTLWIEAGWALAVAVALMIGVWLLSQRIHNAGIVDVAWSLSFTLLASIYAWIGSGWLPRRIAMVSLVSLWSLRLTIHLWRRVAALHPKEDGRYEELRKKWNPNTGIKFLLFFQAQALLAVMLSIPYALVSLNARPSFHPLEIAGALLFLGAWFGEALADHQLSVFTRDPAHRGHTMRSGLWRYSRHPNYFFEWLIWVGWFVMAAGSPWGLVTIYCPLLMLHFLLNVTGVPMAEAGSLKSRGDEYRSYQRVTSRFVPLPPRNGA